MGIQVCGIGLLSHLDFGAQGFRFRVCGRRRDEGLISMYSFQAEQKDNALQNQNLRGLEELRISLPARESVIPMKVVIKRISSPRKEMESSKGCCPRLLTGPTSHVINSMN